MSKVACDDDGVVLDNRDRVRLVCGSGHVWLASLGTVPPVCCFRCGGVLKHEWF